MRKFWYLPFVGLLLIALIWVASDETDAPLSPVNNDKYLSNIYIGSLHSAHTTFSDGQLEYPEEFYSLFKPYWDWIATTDHDGLLTTEEWQSMIKNSNAYNDEKFVSLLGYEWTSWKRGHLSVVFSGEKSSIIEQTLPLTLHYKSDFIWDEGNPKRLYDFLSKADGIVAFSHPAHENYAIDFNQEIVYRDDAIACLVAIISQDTIWWNYTWDTVDGEKIRNTHLPPNVFENGFVKVALDRGYKLGFVAELDLHGKRINERQYCYTGVVAKNLTRQSIFEALKARHTYAVLSPFGLGTRILLRAIHGNYLMGDIFTVNSNIIDITLIGESDLPAFELINLVVNGKIVETRTMQQLSTNQHNFAETFSIILPAKNNYVFFKVRARDNAGHLSFAFTSPMYVTINR